MPRTSRLPVGGFWETYQRFLDAQRGSAIVSIHIAGSLSGTLSSAWAAAKPLPNSTSVEVIDTGELSMGTGWIVLEADRMAKAGPARVEVKRSFESPLPRVRARALIDSLDKLKKCGGTSLVSASLGTALPVKPLVTVQDGQILV